MYFKPNNNTIKMLEPQIDAAYIAISAAHMNYVPLTADEYNQCVTSPHHCTVSSPIRELNSKAHCTITTYTTGHMACPLVEKEATDTKYIYNSNDITIYSVAEPTQLFIKCFDPNRVALQPAATSMTLTGMGEVQFLSLIHISEPTRRS